MKCLRTDCYFTHRKQTYVVSAQRPEVGEDVDVTITHDGAEVYASRVSCRVAFGSGVCRSVFDAWLRSQRPARPGDRPAPRPASPRLFGGSNG